MQNRILKLVALFLVAMLMPALKSVAQNAECKVMLPALTGQYAGDCKKGIAHGIGIAQGDDRYEGQFLRGFPHGTGTYTWADGSVYKGEWEKGLRNGKGEMVYTSTGVTQKGYWKNDKYVGTELINPYTVDRKDNLLSYNFRKMNSDGNEVIIRIMMKGQINTKVRSLNIATNNGTQFKTGLNNGIQNVYFPFDLKITYNTSNPISKASYDVVFECTITEPGKWEVTLNN